MFLNASIANINSVYSVIAFLNSAHSAFAFLDSAYSIIAFLNSAHSAFALLNSIYSVNAFLNSVYLPAMICFRSPPVLSRISSQGATGITLFSPLPFSTPSTVSARIRPMVSKSN